MKVQTQMVRLVRFLNEVHGRTLLTTAKLLCNKVLYLLRRVSLKSSQETLVRVNWHWSRYPFSLRGQTLWSSALHAWFRPEDESAIECMLHMRSYEPVDWVKPVAGEYFLDIGGYIGWYSILAARAVGTEGQVIVLEPDPANMRQLKFNLWLNQVDRVRVLPWAAWSRSGEVPWTFAAEPVWHHIREGGTQTVPCISIDELCERLNLPRLDWIKLDIEGAETEALRGARLTLLHHSPNLFIEIHGVRQEVVSLLNEMGYFVERETYDMPPDKHGWILARHP
jgi:FkbM family methyltransferase